MEDDTDTAAEANEAFLLSLLDERIVAAEERELLAHYDRCIAKAERRQLLARSSKSKGVSLENRRGTILHADGCRPKYLIDTEHAVSSLQYVRVTKLIPRSFLARRDGSSFPIVVLQDSILEMFREDARNQLAHSIHWKGFGISLQSADPSSWRMLVRGYQHTVDLLLVSFRRRLETQSFRVNGLGERNDRSSRFIKAHKVVPRAFLPAARSRNELEQQIVKSFRDQCPNLPEPGNWMGFRVKVRSFNPTSFRLEVTGFHHTVNLLLEHYRDESSRR